MSQAEVTRAESIDEQERARTAEGDKKPKSRRPASAHPPTSAPRTFRKLTRCPRHCFSSATTESLAVSSAIRSFLWLRPGANTFAFARQTDLDPQKCFTAVFHHWRRLRAHRWCSHLGQLSSMQFPFH